MDFDYKLLVKYLIGELSPEERELLKTWRQLSEENERIFSDLFHLCYTKQVMAFSDKEQVEKALHRIVAKKRYSIIPFSIRRTVVYVASILFIVAISVFFLQKYGGDKHETDLFITLNEGDKAKKFQLADGSVVWLREHSTLQVPASFSASNRTVRLTGEAFFDIRRNETSYFRVLTDYMQVEVHGTSFNVRVDTSKKLVETTLVRGSVDLLNISGQKVMDLSPGEQALYSHASNRYEVASVDINLCAAWRFNQFVFENITLREIANQLAAKFDVNINISTSELAHRRFRCVINEEEHLSEILDQLLYLAPIAYRIEGSEIYIIDR